MNEPEKIDPRELSPLALAFVGDSVLELLVRQRLVEHHRLSAGKLNAERSSMSLPGHSSGRSSCWSRSSQRRSWPCSSGAATPARPVWPSTLPPRNTALPPALSACWAGSTSRQMARVEELFDALWQQFDPNQK